MNEQEVMQPRLKRAREVIRECCTELDEDTIACVMLEIGLAEFIYWKVDKGMELTLTDLQTVALAAALAATREWQRDAPIPTVPIVLEEQPPQEPQLVADPVAFDS